MPPVCQLKRRDQDRLTTIHTTTKGASLAPPQRRQTAPRLRLPLHQLDGYNAIMRAPNKGAPQPAGFGNAKSNMPLHEKTSSSKGRPLMPTLSHQARPATKAPLTPRVAQSGPTSRPASAVLPRTPRPEAASVSKSIESDELSTPISSFLGTNVTPRSSARRHKVESRETTPTRTPAPGASEFTQSTNDGRVSRQGMGRNEGREADVPRRPVVTFSSVPPDGRSHRESLNINESKFFHASDVKPAKSQTKPAQPKSPSFFYASGEPMPSPTLPNNLSSGASVIGSTVGSSIEVSEARSTPKFFHADGSSIGAPEEVRTSKFFHADGTLGLAPSQCFPPPHQPSLTSPRLAPSRPASTISTASSAPRRAISPNRLLGQHIPATTSPAKTPSLPSPPPNRPLVNRGQIAPQPPANRRISTEYPKLAPSSSANSSIQGQNSRRISTEYPKQASSPKLSSINSSTQQSAFPPTSRRISVEYATKHRRTPSNSSASGNNASNTNTNTATTTSNATKQHHKRISSSNSLLSSPPLLPNSPDVSVSGLASPLSIGIPEYPEDSTSSLSSSHPDRPKSEIIHSGMQSPIKTSLSAGGTLEQMNELAANARQERKVLDLQIRNGSLEAINRTLEREMRKVQAELRSYKRLSRSGRLSIIPVEAFKAPFGSDDPDGLENMGEDEDPEEEEEEEDLESDDEADGDGDDGEDGKRGKQMQRNEKRLQIDLSKHQQLLLDSQNMNQSLKRCLGWTEELIGEGRKALEYRVRPSEVKLGGRVLAPEEVEGGLLDVHEHEHDDFGEVSEILDGEVVLKETMERQHAALQAVWEMTSEADGVEGYEEH